MRKIRKRKKIKENYNFPQFSTFYSFGKKKKISKVEVMKIKASSVIAILELAYSEIGTTGTIRTVLETKLKAAASSIEEGGYVLSTSAHGTSISYGRYGTDEGLTVGDMVDAYVYLMGLYDQAAESLGNDATQLQIKTAIRSVIVAKKRFVNDYTYFHR